MIVYLDTCSIQRPFDDQSQLRVAMESEAVLRAIQLVEQGDLDLLASETLRIETEQNPHSRRRRFAFGVLGLATRVVETDSQIESRARQYEDIGLRPFDALHLMRCICRLRLKQELTCSAQPTISCSGAGAKRKQKAHECSPRSRS